MKEPRVLHKRHNGTNISNIMSPQKTVTINGHTYDAVSGLMIQPKTETKRPHSIAPSARTSHSSAHRSVTLNRKYTQKPSPAPKVRNERPKTGVHMDIARSGNVKHFAPHPQPVHANRPTETVTPDAPPTIHPIARRTMQAQAAKKQAATPKTPPTAKQLKDAQIEKALAAPKQTNSKKPLPQKHFLSWKRISIMFVALFLLVGVGYAVYRFIPTVSVSFASASAGIKATYPKYTPDGYTLHKPVEHSDGEVKLQFSSNSNMANYYTITQKSSSWSSADVLDNIVKPIAGDNYATTKERGLTIFTHESNAYWVNGRILYTIEGNSTLSSDQIRRIATSL